MSSDFGIDALELESVSKAVLRAFVHSWYQHSEPVLFVGAGFSKFQAVRRPDVPGTSEFGSWDDLMSDFRERLSNGDAEVAGRLPTDALRLAQYFESQFGRATLLDYVERHVPSADFNPGEAHHRLRELPWAAVVTTNYDDLLERTFEWHRRVRRMVVDADLTQRRVINDLIIVKMHGDLKVRDSVVLAEDDYRRYESRRPGLSIKIRQLLTEHPLMFVGFSLTDPNFNRIDGWIRDTVGKVRLPAVAVVHGEPISAERNMWKSRGIELVRLPHAEPMSRLLSALAVERAAAGRSAPTASSYNNRVHDLEAKINEAALVRDDVRGTAKRMASLLVQIIDGASTDEDRGKSAQRVVTHFCWGWRHVLQGNLLAKNIYDEMSVVERRKLLMLALESGNSLLRLESTSSIDPVEELTARDLSRDQEGLMHLYRSRIFRTTGSMSEASSAIGAARAAKPSREVRALVTVEFRELLFLMGDAPQIAAELQKPLDDAADVFAMCRRGSDSLLLGQKMDADSWYSDALERAQNGDERFVSLWGRFASSDRSPGKFSDEDTELLRLLRAIPKSERPATAAAEALHESAAKRLLNGASPEIVIDLLRQYLGEARRLGWPHSSSHRFTLPLEAAAREAARLLLEVDTRDERRFDWIKEGLTLLNCYGLASDVAKLFKVRHCLVLAEAQETVDWFRRFVGTIPTLPRAADARLTTAVCGLWLLEDEAIDRTAEAVVHQTNEWLNESNGGDLLQDWWKRLAENGEGLPRSAASTILDGIARYLPTRKALFVVRPERFSLSLWQQLGYVSAEKSGELVEILEAVFAKGSSAQDSFWLGSTADYLREAIQVGLLNKRERDRIGKALEPALEAELSRSELKPYRLLNLMSVGITAQFESSHRQAFAERAASLVADSENSSLLGFALYCTRAVLSIVTQDDRQKLVDLLLQVGERELRGGRAAFRDRGLVDTLVALAKLEVDSRETIHSMIVRLVEHDPRQLARAGEPLGLQAALSERLRAVASAAILPAVDPSTRGALIRSVGRWLAGQPEFETGLFDEIVSLLAADAFETRVASVEVLEWLVEKAGAERRALALQRIRGLAMNDPHWRVRIASLLCVSRCSITAAEVGNVKEPIELLNGSTLALERRVAEAAARILKTALEDAEASGVSCPAQHSPDRQQ